MTEARGRRGPSFFRTAPAALLLLASCGRQNGLVGAEPGLDATVADAARAPSYRTDFDENAGAWQAQTVLPGASVQFGLPQAGANDPSTAELRFPGHPEYAGTANVGAKFVTEIASAATFGFGTYRTRLQFGACRPSEDAVNAALGYFNDGSDANQNGITDDEEISLQVLCGAPHRLFLTVFTDDQSDGAGGVRFRKLSRVIDFASGEIFDTPAPDKDAFSKTGSDPAWVRPELFAGNAFYVAGFEWHESSLRFFLEWDGVPQTLWTLNDPQHIPQRPIVFLYNLWHPDTHWYPQSGAAAFPAQDVVMHVDWFEYYAE